MKPSLEDLVLHDDAPGTFALISLVSAGLGVGFAPLTRAIPSSESLSF